ncbi:MAG TPA: acyltransferase family protein, partial [Erythrobacter sp.]|nr:acyltransferase family protein [Erythrobacter sp.]
MTLTPGAAMRADIQALRGFAVLAVILYHAGLPLAQNGFLGVDLFFVVSGFLIGGHVLRALEHGDFSFGTFYLRRVRRLIPAAYATLLLTVLGGAFLLTADAHARFAAQALGSLGYVTNVVLWRQINYFNDQSDSEPLLHMWSLAVEEQFYLLLPLALWLLPRGWRGLATIVVTVVSLALYMAIYPRSPGAAFYLLPTRAWELGIGVLTAMLALRQVGEPIARRLALPALALLAGAVLLPLPLPQHWLALPVCLGTAALLLAALPGHRVLRPLERLGDASYSLYLVHWPLFAFAHVIWLGTSPPLAVRIGLVAASLALGWLSWRYIEQPGRFAPVAARRVVALYIAATLAMAGLVTGTAAMVKARPQSIDLAGITGLDQPGCDADAARFDGRCTMGPEPDLLVWGDSFSQQLIPALVASGEANLAQASKGQCAPLPGLAPVDRDATMPFARDCLAFNASVLDYLRRTPSIRVVVLSGNYARYFQPGTRALRGDGSVSAATSADLVAAQRDMARAIRAMGKRVVIVTGPVAARFDFGQCHARQQGGLPTVLPAPDCAIPPEARARPEASVDALFSGFARRGQTPVVRLDRMLCPDPALCPTALEGTALYRDAHHLSRAGSTLAGRRFALG